MTIIQEINSVKWTDFETDYGKANKISKYLKKLFSRDKKLAMDATHHLWCRLCYQHTYISNAALPSYKFIRQGLLTLDDELKLELVDIIKGFAYCTTYEFYKSTNTKMCLWEMELRKQLIYDLDIFKELSKHEHEMTSYLAKEIVAYLTEERND